MDAFFELRTYKILHGKMNEWINFMEGSIIPFQVSKGMVIHGSFTVEEDNEYNIWIRRFDNEQERRAFYKKVYVSDAWFNGMDKIVQTLIDRSATVFKRLKSTDLSVMK